MVDRRGSVYPAGVWRNIEQKRVRPIAQEWAIIEDWIEDDSVYITLGPAPPPDRPSATARGVESAPEDSVEEAAFLPPPRRR